MKMHIPTNRIFYALLLTLSLLGFVLFQAALGYSQTPNPIYAGGIVAGNPTSVYVSGPILPMARAAPCSMARRPFTFPGVMLMWPVTSLYPTIVENDFYLIGLKGNVDALQLFDLKGSGTCLTMVKESEAYRANVPYLSSGLYLLKIIEGAEVHQFKFIKK